MITNDEQKNKEKNNKERTRQGGDNIQVQGQRRPAPYKTVKWGVDTTTTTKTHT